MESSHHRYRRYANDVLTFIEENFDESLWGLAPTDSPNYNLDCYEGIKVCIISPATIGLLAGTWWFFCNSTQLDPRYFYLILQSSEQFGRKECISNLFLWEMICRQGKLVTKVNAAFWHHYITHHIECIKAIFSMFNEYCSNRARQYFGSERLAPTFPLDPAHVFTAEDLKNCHKDKKKLDITGEWVCAYARDSKYYMEKCENTATMRNLIDLYERYRDSDIESFSYMAKVLKERGIQVVRMGNMAINSAPEIIIDYSSHSPTPLMDVFLFAGCKFLIGDGSGVQHIAMLFGKPIVNINWPMIFNYGDGMMEGELILYRKFYDMEKDRYLTLSEIYELEYCLLQDALKNRRGYFNFGNLLIEYMDKHHIQAECNTPKEICDVAKEMLQRINGTIHYSSKVLELRKKYKAMMNEFMQDGFTACIADIGAEWLLENEWFLA